MCVHQAVDQLASVQLHQCAGRLAAEGALRYGGTGSRQAGLRRSQRQVRAQPGQVAGDDLRPAGQEAVVGVGVPFHSWPQRQPPALAQTERFAVTVDRIAWAQQGQRLGMADHGVERAVANVLADQRQRIAGRRDQVDRLSKGRLDASPGSRGGERAG